MKFQDKILMAAVVMTVAAMPATQALAQASTSIEPVNNLATSILNFMTGPIARTAGAIMIAGLGYSMWSGRLDKARAGWGIFGIVLILGSTTIIEWFDSFV